MSFYVRDSKYAHNALEILHFSHSLANNALHSPMHVYTHLTLPPLNTHTQRLEGLDSKIRVFHSRREAGVSRPTSDRDSPFTPMAAEIPASRGATPRLLPRPDHEDNLLLNTPLSSPPDSSIEDSKVPGPSLNRGNIQVNRHWYMR